MGLMKYCTNCFYPASKPDLYFSDQGLCSACIAFNERKNIDWAQREKEFVKLIDYINPISSTRFVYDCIVPVSGGKDSHYQVIKCLEYGLKVLAVTATTCDLTPIGRRNLDNISKLGVDHIEITPDKELRKKINKFTLMEVGDISWSEHQLIFTVPFNIANQMNIPLIFFGESPQQEYGGPKGRQNDFIMDNKWLQEFGGLNGLRVSDLPFDQNNLSQYKLRTGNKNVTACFLGQFFEWDGYKNAITAQKHGFEFFRGCVENSGFEYENLDNYQTGIHDYFKYIKYGFGRATDLVNNHIRRGRMTREQGKDHILYWDGKYKYKYYLGKSIWDILKDINVSKEEYYKIVYSFTNKDLFDVDEASLPEPKFLDDLKNA